MNRILINDNTKELFKNWVTAENKKTIAEDFSKSSDYVNKVIRGAISNDKMLIRLLELAENNKQYSDNFNETITNKLA